MHIPILSLKTSADRGRCKVLGIRVYIEGKVSERVSNLPGGHKSGLKLFSHVTGVFLAKWAFVVAEFDEDHIRGLTTFDGKSLQIDQGVGTRIPDRGNYCFLNATTVCVLPIKDHTLHNGSNR